MEETKNKRIVTGVSLLFMIYIVALRCYTGAENRIILYGGYVIVCGLTFLKLMLSGYGTSLYMPDAAKRLFLFSVYCGSSTLWAINTSGAIGESIFIFACVIMVILLTNYFIRLGNVDMLFTTIMVMGIAMAAVVIIKEGGIGAFYESATLESESDVRVGGEVFNANTIGMVCAYSSIFLFFFAIFYKKRYCYLLMLIPAVASIASASRKSIILLVLGFLMVLYYSQKKQKNIQKYLKVLVGFFVGIIVFRYILSTDIMRSVSKRMEMFLNLFDFDGGVSTDTSTSKRLNMIVVGLRHFLNAPFLGSGMAGSYILNASKLHFSTYSHCDYVEHLVNGGIVGFLLYYSVFIMLIKDYLLFMKKDDDPKVTLSFIMMILFLFMNIACVTYYKEITTYLYFILWISQLEIKKRELDNNSKEN